MQEPFIMHVECRDMAAAERLFKIGEEDEGTLVYVGLWNDSSRWVSWVGERRGCSVRLL